MRRSDDSSYDSTIQLRHLVILYSIQISCHACCTPLTYIIFIVTLSKTISSRAHLATMANFDDPSFFESSIFNFDPTHLAPPPLDGAGPSSNKQQRLSISSTSPSDFLSTFSPAPSSTAGFGPPSLHHTSSSTHSPRSSASPPSLLSLSDSELDDLLNFNSSGEESFSLNNFEEMDQKPSVQNIPMQQQPQQQQPMGYPLFLPNFQLSTMGGTSPSLQGQAGFEFAKSQTDQLANMLFQQHIQQQQQQQQQALSQLQYTMAPEWLRNQNEVLKQQMQYSQPAQNRTSVASLPFSFLPSVRS